MGAHERAVTDDLPEEDAKALEGWAALAADDADARVTVFMSDPSAEAERLTQLLRGAGYAVADVPLSMLAKWVAVQTPRVIVVDADAAGASEAVASLRAEEAALQIEVLLLGESRALGAEPPPGELSDGSSAFFARPIDPAALVKKIDTLTGRPDGGRPASSPPSLRSAQRALPVSERRSPVPASVQPSPAPISARPPPSSGGAMSARSSRRAISIQTTLSPELETLLAEAEHRMDAQMGQEAPPTPEEELEVVLPAALLAALDEPIDDDDDDALVDAPRTRAVPSLEDFLPSEAQHRTNAGRGLTPLPMSVGVETLGVAPTMAAPAPDIIDVPPPIPPPRLPALLAEPDLAPEADPPEPAFVLGPGDAPRQLAAAIAARASGCLTYVSEDGVRRVVLRDGDIVTAASSADDEALLVFLTGRGDLRRDQVKDLVGKLPAFGRHAGAALIGHGLLRQDQLWPTLRAHAEWILGRTLLVARGTSRVEAEPPGRLGQEPGVFGGSSGAEVLVEVVRRVISPEEALRRLGGPEATMTDGPSILLSECALDPSERARIVEARGATLGEVMARADVADLSSVLYALALLGVIIVATPAPAPRPGERDGPATMDAIDAMDVTAVRERVRARFDLVSEADYFTLLGVPRTATGYEVRRAYLELRKSFEPSRILTPELADLDGDVRTIVLVLDEAYEILRDGARRERYRRALGDSP